MVEKARNRMMKNGFEDQAKEFKPEIQFFSEEVKTSKHNEDIKFTNFLNRATPEITKQLVRSVMQNPYIVAGRPDNVRITDKVKNCISLYATDIDDDPLVWKSDIRDASDQQKAVRVYTMFYLPDNDPNAKPLFNIVIIDPFHLVIPSEYKGMTKVEMEHQVYNENRSNSICISTLNSLFD